MANNHSKKTHVIRDPIHGFIELNELEWDIINHPAFQRLRRIRQLGLTDMVYPGAMHTRFEHSIGVMHLASRMFDSITKNSKDYLFNGLDFDETGLKRNRVLIRLSALLHDVGHAPFSHASEEIMPRNSITKKRYSHEDYSCAIIRRRFKDVIENSSYNSQNYGITADLVAQFVDKTTIPQNPLILRDIISSQLDADRADYLLRDSHHAGVQYGQFDLERIVHTLVAGEDSKGTPRIGLTDGGVQAAEGLIIARYMMFTQVYFHRTRRSYDHHLANVVKFLLDQQSSSETFPEPTDDISLTKYLSWDDWRVCGLIHENLLNPDCKKILDRKHDRCFFEKLKPKMEELEEAEEWECLNKDLGAWLDSPNRLNKPWYAPTAQIQILSSGNGVLGPLSEHSDVVKELGEFEGVRVYIPYANKSKIKKPVSKHE